MDDVSALQHTIQQQNQRINSLEELLRRSEGSLGAVLNRVKDVELGMNNFHKLIQQLVSENVALGKELSNSKQRADLIDRSWRSHVQQSETAIWTELRSGASSRQSNNNNGGAITDSAAVSRLMQELTQQRSQISDLELGVNRLTDAHSTDSNVLRMCEQHVQNNENQIAELMTLQREGAKDTIRRFEQAFREINQQKSDADRAINNLKQQTERQLRDSSISLEQHAASLTTLQSEVGSTIRSIREEVATSINQLSQGYRENETAAKTLEQILRAEVQTRGQNVDQLNRKVSILEQSVNSKLPMVQMHHQDISRLWDTLRATQHNRDRSERLESVLSSVGGADAGVGMIRNNSSTGNINNNTAMEHVKDLEASTAERFDLIDNHVLQLAETLKRAHSGVEEQVDSLASRFGRMEMRLEKVAARKEETEKETAKMLMNLRNSISGSGNNSGENTTNTNGEQNSSSSFPGAETIVKEVVETRLRVDKLDAAVEEVKFDVADLLDAISAETTDLNRRLESVEGKQHHQSQPSQQSTGRPPLQSTSTPTRVSVSGSGGVAAMNLRSNNTNNNNNNNNSSLNNSGRSNNNNHNQSNNLDARSNAELLADFAGGAEVIDTSASPSM